MPSNEIQKFSVNRFPFDPAKITRPIALLAVLAGILWAISLTWLLVADTGDERTIAGIIVALMFGSLLVLIMFVSRTSLDPIANASLPPDQTSQLAKNLVRSPVVTQATVKEPHIISGKDSDYILDDPRPHWSVRWISGAKMIAEETGVKDASLHFELQKRLPDADIYSENVLNIYSPNKYDIVLDPKRSKINDLPSLVMIHAPALSQVIIVPFNKFSSLRGRQETLLSFTAP